MPARADDAAAMLRTCLAAAITDSTLSVFLNRSRCTTDETFTRRPIRRGRPLIMTITCRSVVPRAMAVDLRH